jgi:hypothetical protein
MFKGNEWGEIINYVLEILDEKYKICLEDKKKWKNFCSLIGAF